MKIEEVKIEDYNGLKLSGHITYINVNELNKFLKKEIQFVDLTDANFIDSFILGVLISYEKKILV